MSQLLSMARLRENEQARVARLDAHAPLLQRFAELGLIEGTRIECLHRRRGIAAYLIRGSVIAVRDADCAGVLVQPEATR